MKAEGQAPIPFFTAIYAAAFAAGFLARSRPAYVRSGRNPKQENMEICRELFRVGSEARFRDRVTPVLAEEAGAINSCPPSTTEKVTRT